MSPATDLIQLAELIKLAGETVMMLGTTAADDEHSRLSDCARRIQAIADELAEIGRGLERKPFTPP